MAQCQEGVYRGERFHRKYVECGKPAKVEECGKHYCGIHSPAKKRAKDVAYELKLRADREMWRRKALIETATRGMTGEQVVEAVNQWKNATVEGK